MALFAVSFYPCRTTVLEPEPLALVLFLLIFLESWLVLSGKNDTLQEFLLCASTALGQHTPAGHYPIISSEHKHCRDSLRYTWEPGNCFAGCCGKLISKVQLETLLDLLHLLSWEQAADQGPVSCAGSCRMRSQALFLINIHC